MGRTQNKSFYHFKIVEQKEDEKNIRFFKTLKECGDFYNCSSRLLGYKLKNNNENIKGKLYNIFIYRCKEQVIYEERKHDTNFLEKDLKEKDLEKLTYLERKEILDKDNLNEIKNIIKNENLNLDIHNKLFKLINDTKSQLDLHIIINHEIHNEMELQQKYFYD